jgi:hypothetical protein
MASASSDPAKPPSVMDKVSLWAHSRVKPLSPSHSDVKIHIFCRLQVVMAEAAEAEAASSFMSETSASTPANKPWSRSSPSEPSSHSLGP